MSEYQYYKFQAVDRPLTEKEMGELRSFSTRARITPTSFVNDYAWGSFRGNADARPRSARRPRRVGSGKPRLPGRGTSAKSLAANPSCGPKSTA